MADAALDIISTPIRFIPPNGEEWPAVPEWTPMEWAHWLREHNKYPFLRAWSEDEIAQYVNVDRYRYGFGLRSPKSQEFHWFYNPTPIAVPFHACKTPNILFGGAAGGSKSHSARWDAYRHCFTIPSFKAIIMRRTHEELKRNHLDMAIREEARINYFMKQCGQPPVMEVVPSEHEIRFINIHKPGEDSKIILGHCKNEGDEEKYLGDAYDAFYPDEAATFTKKQITGVAGRLRSEKRGIKARLGATSNPGGANTLWLKEYYIDKDEKKICAENPRYKPQNHTFIQAMLWDNPYYMDPDGTYTTYEERLFEYDPERRRQLLLGDWDALTGQFFPEFSKMRHVRQMQVPAGAKIEVWIDWGYTPHYGMALWVAIFPNGRIYVFYEWKFNGASARQLLVAAEVSKRIHKLTMEEVLPLVRIRRVSKRIGDPSMWNADGHSGEDYAETFARNSVPMVKGDNDRAMGWGRFRHWLMDAPDGDPWMMFHPRCEVTIRTIPTLVRDDHDPDDCDTHGEDHPADAVRYGVMGRPSPTVMLMSNPLILPDSPRALLKELESATVRAVGQVS